MMDARAKDRLAPTPSVTHAAEGVEQLDVTAVNSTEARKLYKKREQIYPKLVFGPFRSVKWAILFFTLGVYYLLPWVRWPRGAEEPSQAVLADFAGQRFYFFFIEIWPQEVYYITGLLIASALALFLVTGLFGRLWCGYTCPQTVWTDLYIAVERMIEGDRNQRMKLDKAPLSVGKLAKKLSKHLIWLVIAFLTGGAFIMYFHDAPTIARDFFVGQAPGSAYLFAGILTFTTYSLAGLMREQVCTYMCPWPRIQGAMTDNETLEVTYKFDRGEPSGPHKRGESWDGRGDCIDCRQCVAACPMGIDIRDGDQLECINCGLCIDACDSIMAKIERPKGLIAYDSETNRTRRAEGLGPRLRLLRPRIVVYAGALALVCGIMLAGLATRTTIDLNVLRDRNPNFVRVADGAVRNGYTVKLINKAGAPRDFTLETTAPTGSTVKITGMPDLPDPIVLTVDGDTVGTYRFFLTVPREAAESAHSLPITFTATALDIGESKRAETVFQTGAPR